MGVYVLKDCLRQCLYLEYCYVASFDDITNQCFVQMELEIKPLPKNENSTLKTYEFKRDEYLKGELKQNIKY